MATKKEALRTRKPKKDPGSGLTAKGRRAFARKDGAHLRPGVQKARRDMTPAEMRRKGSWAVRFYGRTGALPRLVKIPVPTLTISVQYCSDIGQSTKKGGSHVDLRKPRSSR